MGIVDFHGCSALIAVAGYHLFPDFIGGADEKARKQAIVSSRRVVRELMKLAVPVPLSRVSVPRSVFFVARICFLVSFTQDASEVFASGWFRQMAGEDAGNAELPSESAPV